MRTEENLSILLIKECLEIVSCFNTFMIIYFDDMFSFILKQNTLFKGGLNFLRVIIPSASGEMDEALKSMQN